MKQRPEYVAQLYESTLYMLAVSYLQGDSPLMCAASDGHAEVVKQLVAYGADTSAKNKVAPGQLP